MTIDMHWLRFWSEGLWIRNDLRLLEAWLRERELDCYWVGSLGFNFWWKSRGFPLNPQQVKLFFAEGSTATKRRPCRTVVVGSASVLVQILFLVALVLVLTKPHLLHGSAEEGARDVSDERPRYDLCFDLQHQGRWGVRKRAGTLTHQQHESLGSQWGRMFRDRAGFKQAVFLEWHEGNSAFSCFLDSFFFFFLWGEGGAGLLQPIVVQSGALMFVPWTGASGCI